MAEQADIDRVVQLLIDDENLGKALIDSVQAAIDRAEVEVTETQFWAILVRLASYAIVIPKPRYYGHSEVE